MIIDFNELRRIVVSIDPATTHNENSDDTGIVVVAHGPHIDLASKPCKLMEMTGRCAGHGYVLGDFTCHLAPHGWAKRAVALYDRFEADRVIAEVNNGGDMVGETIHAVRAGVPYTSVRASRGKHIRAEPVAALWEQGRCHFVDSSPELEDECTSWSKDAIWSPNRLDALVWGFTALGLIGGQGEAFLRVWSGQTKERLANPEDVKSKELASLANVIKLRPKYGERAEQAPVSDCDHRWRGDFCVFCAQPKSELEVAPPRGGLRG